MVGRIQSYKQDANSNHGSATCHLSHFCFMSVSKLNSMFSTSLLALVFYKSKFKISLTTISTWESGLNLKWSQIILISSPWTTW